MAKTYMTVEITAKSVKTVYWYINLIKYRMKIFRMAWLDNKPLVKLYINGKLERVITCNDLANILYKP